MVVGPGTLYIWPESLLQFNAYYHLTYPDIGFSASVTYMHVIPVPAAMRLPMPRQILPFGKEPVPDPEDST